MSKSFVLWVLEPGQGLPHSYQYHLNRNELNKNVLSLFVSVGSHCFDFLGKEPIWEIQVKTRKCFEMENSFGFELAKEPFWKNLKFSEAKKLLWKWA